LLKTIPAEQLIYVDETGIDQYVHREFAYSPRGEKVLDKISGKKCGVHRERKAYDCPFLRAADQKPH